MEPVWRVRIQAIARVMAGRGGIGGAHAPRRREVVHDARMDEDGAGYAPVKPSWSVVTIGVVAGLVPLGIQTSSSSAVFENGRVVSSTYRDWLAIGGGAVALGCGLLAAVLAVKAKQTQRIAIGLAVLALGAFQIARGLGVFQPAPEAPSHLAGLDDRPMRIAPPRAAPTAETCADADACNDVGHELEETDDLKGALAAYVRGCELGGGMPCFNAAIMYRTAQGSPEDAAKATALQVKACELGFADGCADAGANHITGYGVTTDLARAHVLLTRGCTAKSGLACYNLGVVTRDGLGIPPDETKAFALFAMACTLDHGGGCNEQGVAAMLGRGTARDLPAAVAPLEKACSLTARHCFALGVLYNDGDGVERDQARARQLYDKACGAGHATACNNLGSMNKDGRGGPKDVERAKALYKLACDGEEALGCKNLAALN